MTTRIKVDNEKVIVVKHCPICDHDKALKVFDDSTGEYYYQCLKCWNTWIVEWD